MVLEFNGKKPKISESAFIAETAVLIGDVEVEEGASIWFGAVLRADIGKIIVKKSVNIQDNAVIHTDEGQICLIGDNVTVGHSAIIHSAEISENVLIGMHATVLSGAKIAPYCIIGANSLVLENALIEEGSLAVGIPAKVVRKLSEKERNSIREHAIGYAGLAEKYKK